MTAAPPTLYYVYDPMCSWCWGYKPVWEEVQNGLRDIVNIEYILGGLAKDTDAPMPTEMRLLIADYWKKIENLLGTQFNHDFWKLNTPRRSTYPSCRAILAAREQNAELEMLTGIQTAYYLQAKNPSDTKVLLQLSHDLGLDSSQFEEAFCSERIETQLTNEISFARNLGVVSFPSLVLLLENKVIALPINYHDSVGTIKKVQAAVL